MGGAGDVLNWTILYIPLVGIFGLWSVRFLLQLPRNIALMMILSGILFCFGAVGLELLNKPEFQQLLSVSLSESYQFGVAKPTSINVNTFNSEKISKQAIEKIVEEKFDLRPKSLINMLDLKRPIYLPTAAYGHFGRTDIDLSWEKTDRASEISQ